MTEIPAKILLVDDIQDNLTALEALLKRPDVEVFSVSSATKALELMLKHEFALAVVDVQMPEVSGFELAQMMRSTERTRHIPIVFVTAGSIEATNVLKGYQSGAIDFMYKPLDSHTVRSKVNVFIDLYRHRSALNRQVAELEQARLQQQELLEQLQQTQRELEQAMQLRDQFMSIVSHELRTPLNTLKLELYTRRIYIENGEFDIFTPEKLMAMVDSDERQLNRLVRLINDMTDVSRIRTGQLSMRASEVNLATLVQRSVEQFESQIKLANCSARLHFSGDVKAEADEFRIEQAFINLLTNAIRHCNAKPIDIFLEDQGDQVSIEVRDCGLGIEPEDQQRIFQLFERGSRERKGSGLGLGLFIANQIVTAHGGQLSVSSSPGEGSSFRLLLPKRAAFEN
ncbi:MAG: hybrid sensor histidine kinase/response regulator [Spongiibacteraceae bacterium]